jgi:hypothetical protein
MTFPVAQVSDAGISSLSNDGKISMTIEDRVAGRSTLPTPKSCHHWREPFHSAYSLAEVIDVSDSTIIRYPRDSLRMQNFYFPWVPYELTADLGRHRPEICERPLPSLETRGPDSFQMLVTEDKKRFANMRIISVTTPCDVQTIFQMENYCHRFHLKHTPNGQSSRPEPSWPHVCPWLLSR